MDNQSLTKEQRLEIEQFASAFLSKKDILKIMELSDNKDIDLIIEIARLKQIAKINNAVFKLAAGNSSEAIKQALKIIDSRNQSKV